MSTNKKIDRPSILRLVSVSKSYGKQRVLSALNIKIMPGEFVVLLGPNGAGKTTLFQLLTGLFVADEGSIFINELDIRHHAVKTLSIVGVVFQQATLDLDLSVRANLRFYSSLHGISRKEADIRIQQELERLGLYHSVDDITRDLSGGNRRKVELARALLHRPRILFMDEASIGLDPMSRKSLLDYVSNLCKTRDVTFFWATHLVDEAAYASRILVLNRGELLMDSSPSGMVESTGTHDISAAFFKLIRSTGVSKEEILCN